jgi:hypothetical protein
MSDQEKRNDARYGLELPIWVKWEDGSGRAGEATGRTINISPSGALIVCDSPIGKGCNVDLQIQLPVGIAGTIMSPVSAKGRVVRDVIETEPATRYGHGIMFDQFRFGEA